MSEDYEWEPSEYKDLVLDVKYRGESLPAGARVDEGTELTLVVGFGKGTEMTDVPNVVGRSLPEARALLLNQRLTVGTVEFDEPIGELKVATCRWSICKPPNWGSECWKVLW